MWSPGRRRGCSCPAPRRRTLPGLGRRSELPPTAWTMSPRMSSAACPPGRTRNQWRDGDGGASWMTSSPNASFSSLIAVPVPLRAEGAAHHLLMHLHRRAGLAGDLVEAAHRAGQVVRLPPITASTSRPSGRSCPVRPARGLPQHTLGQGVGGLLRGDGAAGPGGPGAASSRSSWLVRRRLRWSGRRGEHVRHLGDQADMCRGHATRSGSTAPRRPMRRCLTKTAR